LSGVCGLLFPARYLQWNLARSHFQHSFIPFQKMMQSPKY
jgi:hypothetical protein